MFITKLAKRLIQITLSLSIFSIGCSSSYTTPLPSPIKIRVIQTLEHPALDLARKGLLDELIAQGYKPGENLNWAWQSAQGNLSIASSIAQKYAAEADIIVCIGTSAAQAALSALKGKGTLVFGSITSPALAGLTPDKAPPGIQITGVSDFVGVQEQFEAFQKILKLDKKGSTMRIGVIYNPGELNSASLMEKMQKIAKKMGTVVVVPSPAIRTCDVADAARKLVAQGVDALFVNNDNTALAAFKSVITVGQKNTEKPTPVFVSDVDIVDQGALAALGPDQYKGGRFLGQKVIQIIKGKKARDIPIERMKDIELVINLKAAKHAKIDIDPDLLKQAAKVIR